MTDTPLNDLETAIREGMAGRGTPGEFHVAMLDAILFVPSVTKVTEDGTFTPLLLPSERGDVGMVIAFTDPSRITEAAAERAPFVFEVRGSRLVANLAPDRGLIIFAGPDAAGEIDHNTLGALRGVLTRGA